MQSDIIKQIQITNLIRCEWLWGFGLPKKYVIIIIIENHRLTSAVYRLCILHCTSHTPSLSFAEILLLKTIFTCFSYRFEFQLKITCLCVCVCVFTVIRRMHK